MQHDTSSYGLWSLVIINSFLFILFAFSFTKLKTKRDWRSTGPFSAFVIAYFTEMYGFPLTIYLLSGWLSKYYPGIDFYSHDSGHLWHLILGFKGDPHFGPVHLISNIFIIFGLILLSYAWGILYNAQKRNKLATTGPYKVIRHPQYMGFIIIMVGFIFQWPTLLTLIMFPVLVVVYTKLALEEEKDLMKIFGKDYQHYAQVTPRFIPNLLRAQSDSQKSIKK